MAVNRYLGDFEDVKPKAEAPTRTRPSPLIPKDLNPFPTLESGKYLQEITGEVVGDVEVREVNTKSGPKPIANFYLTDGKAKIRVALWEDFVSEAEKLKSGDVITLKGMSIRPPYKGEEQISSTKNTEIL